MGTGFMDKINTTLGEVNDNIVTIGSTIVTIAVIVFGFRWMKAQFF